MGMDPWIEGWKDPWIHGCTGGCWMGGSCFAKLMLPFPLPAPSAEPGAWIGLFWFQFQEEQREWGHVVPIRERLCRSRRENPTLRNGDGLGSTGLSSFLGEPQYFWCKNINRQTRVIPNGSSCIPSILGTFPCLPISFGDLSHIFEPCTSQIPADLFCWLTNSSELLVSRRWQSRITGKG